MLPPDPNPPSPPRSPAGRGYPAEVVAAVRGLVEGEGLSYREAAARSGLREGLVGEWARRFGWRRGLPSPLRGGPSRREAPPGVGVEQTAPPALEPVRPPPRLGLPAESVPPRQGEGKARRPCRHPPELREAARVRIEGSRDGMERIANALGVNRGVLYAWRKRFGWVRPAPPDRGAPQHHRSRRFGRGYGGDAVGIARDLVTGSTLPLRRIAAQAGISKATLCRWMKERGWVRHPAVKNTGRKEPYGPAVMAAARRLYTQTELPTVNIAARVKTTPGRIAFWAKRDGWTRPRDMPDAHGRLPRRRRRRAPLPRPAAGRG